MTFKEKFNIQIKKELVILIAPLDWGLGHATRCVPIIKYLNSTGCKVIVACEGIQQSLLEKEFPGIRFVKLQGYRILFSKSGGKTLIRILSQIPKILISINRENSWLRDFLAKNEVDAVISDNRYGFFNKKVHTVFITHQLTIKNPFGNLVESMLRKMNYHYINRFTECWVPDFKDSANNMGGKLSHPGRMPAVPVKYIGRLSRMEKEKSGVKDVKLMMILSGPEPQRTIFENILLSQLETYHGTTILVRGLPGEATALVSNQKNLSIYNHLPGELLNHFINESTFIISRSGYSTVMDLIDSGKKCIFVPTPGQSEQEYLAEYLSSKNFCLSYSQSEFDLEKAIIEAASFDFSVIDIPAIELYKTVIANFTENLIADS